MSFMNTIRMSNGFNPGQDRRPDLVPNYLHRLPAYNKRSQIACKDVITRPRTIQFCVYYRTQQDKDKKN